MGNWIPGVSVDLPDVPDVELPDIPDLPDIELPDIELPDISISVDDLASIDPHDLTSALPALGLDIWHPAGRPEVLRTAAGAWHDMAGHLESFADDLESRAHALQASWEGAAAVAFGEHLTSRVGAIRDQLGEFRTQANNLDQTANKIEETNTWCRKCIIWLGIALVAAVALIGLTAGGALPVAMSAITTVLSWIVALISSLGALLTTIASSIGAAFVIAWGVEFTANLSIELAFDYANDGKIDDTTAGDVAVIGAVSLLSPSISGVGSTAVSRSDDFYRALGHYSDEIQQVTRPYTSKAVSWGSRHSEGLTEATSGFLQPFATSTLTGSNPLSAGNLVNGLVGSIFGIGGSRASTRITSWLDIEERLDRYPRISRRFEMTSDPPTDPSRLADDGTWQSTFKDWERVRPPHRKGADEVVGQVLMWPFKTATKFLGTIINQADGSHSESGSNDSSADESRNSPGQESSRPSPRSAPTAPDDAPRGDSH